MATPAAPQSSEDFDYIFKSMCYNSFNIECANIYTPVSVVLAGDSGVGYDCVIFVVYSSYSQHFQEILFVE